MKNAYPSSKSSSNEADPLGAPVRVEMDTEHKLSTCVHKVVDTLKDGKRVMTCGVLEGKRSGHRSQ